MDWGLFWTIVGALASFYGAYLSFCQYRKAKKIAKEISERKLTMDLSYFIESELKPFEQTCISYTINKKGRSVNVFISKLQHLISSLNVIKSKTENGKINHLYNSLIDKADILHSDNDEIYNEILGIIRDLIALLSTITNNNIYKA